MYYLLQKVDYNIRIIFRFYNTLRWGTKKYFKERTKKKYDASKGQLDQAENIEMFYLLKRCYYLLYSILPKLAITCAQKLGEYLVICRALGHLRHSLTQTLKSLM